MKPRLVVCLGQLSSGSVSHLAAGAILNDEVLKGLLHAVQDVLRLYLFPSVQVPLLLWVAVVIVIFSVCTSRVQDLEGPLANLSTAARVRALIAR